METLQDFVSRLPEAGAIVVTPQEDEAFRIRQYIIAYRSLDTLRKTWVVTVCTPHDAEMALAGKAAPVYLSPSFFAGGQSPETHRAVLRLANEANERHQQSQRGTGRTKALVMSLPVDGATVVVPSPNEARYIMQMIADIRGADALRKTHVEVVRSRHDAALIGRGRSGPVYIDHSFFEGKPADLARYTIDIVASINKARGYQVAA